MRSAKGIKKTTHVSQEGHATEEQQLMLCGVSRIKFTQGALRDSLQHLFGKDSEQLPPNVQSLIDTAIFVRTLKKSAMN